PPVLLTGQPLPQLTAAVRGDEVQQLTFTGTITGGQFTLTYNTTLTANVNYDATPGSGPTQTAANITAALNTMFFGDPLGVNGISGVIVTVTSPTTYKIEFGNNGGGNPALANMALA